MTAQDVIAWLVMALAAAYLVRRLLAPRARKPLRPDVPLSRLTRKPPSGGCHRD